MNKLMNEMESQKELLLTYEQTLSHKDSIVANVTNAIQKQVGWSIGEGVSTLAGLRERASEEQWEFVESGNTD